MLIKGCLLMSKSHWIICWELPANCSFGKESRKTQEDQASVREPRSRLPRFRLYYSPLKSGCGHQAPAWPISSLVLIVTFLQKSPAAQARLWTTERTSDCWATTDLSLWSVLTRMRSVSLAHLGDVSPRLNDKLNHWGSTKGSLTGRDPGLYKRSCWLNTRTWVWIPSDHIKTLALLCAPVTPGL